MEEGVLTLWPFSKYDLGQIGCKLREVEGYEGKNKYGKKDIFVTSNYKILREQLLTRCDKEILARDVKELEESQTYLQLVASDEYLQLDDDDDEATKYMRDDVAEYMRDRPLFAQFVAGNQQKTEYCYQNGCIVKDCDRVDCDLYHAYGTDPLYNGWCHCSHTGLVYIWTVRNIHTERIAWVGSHCVDHFDEPVRLEYERFMKCAFSKGRTLLHDLRIFIAENEARDDDDEDEEPIDPQLLQRLKSILVENISPSMLYEKYGVELETIISPNKMTAFIDDDELDEEEGQGPSSSPSSSSFDSFLDHLQERYSRPDYESVVGEDGEDEDEEDDDEPVVKRLKKTVIVVDELSSSVEIYEEEEENGVEEEIAASFAIRKTSPTPYVVGSPEHTAQLKRYKDAADTIAKYRLTHPELIKKYC
jgi:hypothetical protein